MYKKYVKAEWSIMGTGKYYAGTTDELTQIKERLLNNYGKYPCKSRGLCLSAEICEEAVEPLRQIEVHDE